MVLIFIVQGVLLASSLYSWGQDTTSLGPGMLSFMDGVSSVGCSFMQ